MILSAQQIVDIILNNPGLPRVNKGVAYSKKLQAHIHGKDVDNLEAFSQIDGFERLSLKKLRAKYAKSNKDLFARLSRPLDKVFSARGGSVYINLPETAEKKAELLATNVRNGISVRKWVETTWTPHLLDDPFGIVFMEMLPKQEAIIAKNEGRPWVYPTYRSIQDIYDYLPKGNRLEYVVFTVSAEEKRAYGVDEKSTIYRLVDDAADYLIRKEDKKAEILTAFTLPNYFGEVPGMINSDLPDPTADNCFLSLFDKAIELADEFLLTGSIQTTHKFLHGFPKYAEFASQCPECGGTGVHEGKKCEDCKGAGTRPISRVSDMKLLAFPESKDDPIILPSDVGAYISPDKTFHEISTADLQLLEDKMHVTIWGARSQQQTSGLAASQSGDTKTATEIVSEFKPQADRLVAVSEMAEARHKFILDNIIRMQVQPYYTGSSVNYGRRYMLESPDEIWLKYSDARTKGAPQNVLDSLLNEYFEANYQSDPIGLQISKKLMYVEPFVHLSALQLKVLTPDPLDYKSKLYFSEWLAQQNNGALLSQDVATLRQSLDTYAAGKKIPEPQLQLPAA